MSMISSHKDVDLLLILILACMDVGRWWTKVVGVSSIVVCLCIFLSTPILPPDFAMQRILFFN
uniref:Uncharacterized protein n=1 Tax=viral metagenome TaxID=1070528 RepID=A0A6C0BES3_9ZZZZ